jgi:hypothetical protein
MGVIRLNSPQIRELARAFELCLTMRARSARDHVVDEVLADCGAMERSNAMRTDLIEIVTWANATERVERLESAVYEYEGDTIGIRTVRIKLDEFVALVERQQRETLGRLIEETGFTIEECDRYCVQSAGRFPMLTRPASIASMVLHLACVPIQEPYPLFEFAEKIAAALPAGTAVQGIRRWVDEVAAAQPFSFTREQIRLLRERVQQRERPYLSVEVDKSKDEWGKYRVNIWLWSDRLHCEPRSVREGAVSADGVLSILLEEIEQLRKERPDDLSHIFVEFFLPRKLLRLNVDQWKVAFGLGEERILGELCPVVIRSLERKNARELHRNWWEKWGELQALPYPPTSAPYVVAFPETDVETLSQLVECDGIVCVALDYVLPECQEILDPLYRCFNRGLPVAIWLRQECDTAVAEQEIRRVLDHNVLRDLPFLIRERRKRGNADIWKCVSLLWDDPQRIPGDSRILAAPAKLE